MPIEEIAVGDYVWATDPETGVTELKQVTQLFRNETNELIHVTVNGEEITCTPNHPFYSPVKGWTSACKLRAGDVLVALNGEYVVVEQIQHELLECPETTYNFEVGDFHTYYVGYEPILVHNKNCYELIRDNDMRAVINSREKEKPHAHIFKKKTNIGRIFKNGDMDTSLKQSDEGMGFVKKHYDEIMKLIGDYYGRR